MSKRTLLPRIGLALAFAASLLTARPTLADTITVTHWGGQFYGVPYAVAMDKGMFKKAGIDITGILTASGGGTAIRNTLAGDIPFGEVSLAAAVQAVDAGQPLVIVGGGTQTVSDQIWVVKPDSPLKSFKDLAGKKIGYTAPGSVSNMVILMALKANGMTAQQVTLVPAGDLGANLSAVSSGAIDAGFSDELVYAQNKNLARPLFYVRDVMSPKMEQTVLVTTRDYAKSHGDEVRKLIAARREGMVYTRAHPDEAADIVAKAYNNPHADLFRVHMAELIKENYWSDGALDYEAMDHMVEGLVITGQLKGKVDWPKYIDTSFLPADLRAAK